MDGPPALSDASLADLLHPSAALPSPFAEGFLRYGTSKLCLVRAIGPLARELHTRSIRVVGFDPGLVPGTGLARDATPAQRAAWRALSPLLLLAPGARHPAGSARDLARLVLDERYASMTDAHLTGRRPSGTSVASYHLAAAHRWYDDTLRVIGVRNLGAARLGSAEPPATQGCDEAEGVAMRRRPHPPGRLTGRYTGDSGRAPGSRARAASRSSTSTSRCSCCAPVPSPQAGGR